MFRSVLTEPLIHFLALGLALFLAYGSLNSTAILENPNTIIVDRTELLNHIQHRAKRFDPDFFGPKLDKMPEEDKNRLVDDYVREEVLYREAKAMGFDKSDYTVRRRLVQQMEYVYRSLLEAQAPPAQSLIDEYYQANAERYRKPAEITFTHVFVKSDKPGAEQTAKNLLQTLQQKSIPFHEALAYGDRFLYHRNYVRKESDVIASHFGDAMQASLFSISPEAGQWHGPFQSPYGWHLAMVTEMSPSVVPPLQEVAGKVLQDVLRKRQQEQMEVLMASVVKRYKVERALADPVQENILSQQIETEAEQKIAQQAQ